MKISELDQPRIGDIVEFETDPDTVVEGLIVNETDDGYIYEFSESGYTELDETCTYGKYYCSTDKKYKCRKGPKQSRNVAEAEYQGREVPLGRPMRGDVKKFKVYVRDPKSGNVKKINFGHGGTSAKRLGQKTMRIKRSNPARRRNFRARHRCNTAKNRMTARYWSCRAW